MVQGLLWYAVGWILLGLSQVAVVRAFDPAGGFALFGLGLVPVVIASVALATVPAFWWPCSRAGWECARGC